MVVGLQWEVAEGVVAVLFLVVPAAGVVEEGRPWKRVRRRAVRLARQINFVLERLTQQRMLYLASCSTNPA